MEKITSIRNKSVFLCYTLLTIGFKFHFFLLNSFCIEYVNTFVVLQ